MDEENKKETEINKPENPAENSNDGLPTLEENPIRQAQELLKEIHKENLLMIEERKRIEKATAEMLINGRSYAGQSSKVETAEEKSKREAKEFFKGSEIEKAIEKHG